MTIFKRLTALLAIRREIKKWQSSAPFPGDNFWGSGDQKAANLSIAFDRWAQSRPSCSDYGATCAFSEGSDHCMNCTGHKDGRKSPAEVSVFAKLKAEYFRMAQPYLD